MDAMDLPESWTLFFHDPYNEYWSAQSSKALGEIVTAEHFWETRPPPPQVRFARKPGGRGPISLNGV